MSSKDSTLGALRNIVDNADRIRSRLDHVSPCPDILQSHIVPPTVFSLPKATPIASILMQSGVTRTTAERLSQMHMQNATKLKAEFERRIDAATQTYMTNMAFSDRGQEISVLQSGCLSLYLQTLRQWTVLSLQRALSSSEKEQVRRVEANKETKQFGQHTILMLEDMFFRNAYPSRAEKAMVASKTGLDLKQIHIWFQNRRSRLRREGKEVYSHMSFTRGAKATCTPSCLPQDGSMSSLLANSHQTTSNQHHPSSITHSETLSDPFVLISPPYAFPAPYPAVCDYDPLPSTASLCRSQDFWPRQRPKEAAPCHSTLYDIGLLSQMFSEVTMTGSKVHCLVSGTALLDKEPHQHVPPCLPFWVKASPAPLPALVRTDVTVGSGSTFSHRSRGGLSRDNLSLLCGKNQAHDEFWSSRKPVTRLARGALNSPPHLIRNQAHPYGLLPSHHSRKRLASTSSSSSVCSDASGFSVSSSPSSVDSPLATPPQLPLGLPIPYKLSADAFMFGHHSDLDQILNLSPASFRPDEEFHLSALAC